MKQFGYLIRTSHWSRSLGRTGYFGKISAQPHPTLCIQFLDRENNDKNNTLPLGKQICFTIYSMGLCGNFTKVITHTSHVFNMSMFHAPAQMIVKNVVIYLINPFVFVKLELYKPFFNVFYSKILKVTLWRVMTNATIIILPKQDIDQTLLGEVDDVGHEMPSTSSVEGKFCTSQSCF